MKRWLLASLPFIACSPVWTKPIQLDTFPERPMRVCVQVTAPELAEGARQAIRVWDTALGLWRRVEESVEPLCDIIVTSGSCLSPTALACTNRLGGGLIKVRADLSLRYPSIIIEHEMGHALGAQHVSYTLMHPTSDAMTHCPDKTTMAQVAAYWRIDMRLLRYCY